VRTSRAEISLQRQLSPCSQVVGTREQITGQGVRQFNGPTLVATLMIP